jgi:3-methyladenine DNA glycosylase AlkD
MCASGSRTEEMLASIRAFASPKNFAMQSRFGIQGRERLGVSLYEARMLAGMIDEPAKVTLTQMEAWVVEFDSWDICDIISDELFIHSPDMLEVIPRWAIRNEEFVKRAAFAMIAALVVHRTDIPDEVVRRYFSVIEAAANDNRNFVKKAVNWALRNIGKWKPTLRSEAVACAKRLLVQDTPSARWIAKDAIKEFIHKFGGSNEI